jgi:hypothetical protein
MRALKEGYDEEEWGVGIFLWRSLEQALYYAPQT